MFEEQLRWRRAGQTGLFSAKLNVAAMIAMILVLRPGLPPTPASERLRYFRDHGSLVAWRWSWALWVVATAALILFYLCLHRALRSKWRGRLAVGLAAAGFLADLAGDWLYLAEYPTLHQGGSIERLDRLTAALSGGVANGAYTVAWTLLAWRAPFPKGFLIAAVPGLAGGYVLAVSGLVNWVPGLVAGTVIAIPAFAVWAFLVGRFCWKKSAPADTMSPHV